MALNPRVAFQAPQIVGPQGLASQGPAAAARATGGVPPIAMGQGVNMPAPQVPAGLAALQSQNQAAQGTENLIVNMQNEVGNAANSSELNPMLLGAGTAMRQGADKLAGGGGDESLVGGSPGEDMLDDGSYAEATSAPPASLASSALPVIPDNITNEQARTIARETMGLTGEEDNEDAYTALMMFGLGLMATPGDLGQAIGKAGLNAMPQIIAARKSQRGRRKDVGVMAYQIQEKNKAQRVAARTATAKHLVGNQKLSLDIMKEINAGSAKTLEALPEYLRGIVANKMKAPDFNNILGYVTRGNIGGALSGAQNATQLAISELRRDGTIKDGDLKGFPDRGWQKFLEYGPAGSANENMVRTSMVATKAVGGVEADPNGQWKKGGVGEYQGISQWGPKGDQSETSMVLTDNGKGGIVLYQNTGVGAGARTGLQIQKKQGLELQGAEREVVSLVSKAEQLITEINRVGTVGLSPPTRAAGTIVAAGADFLAAVGWEKGGDAMRKAYTGFYTGITKLSKTDHAISRDSEAGIWLGNKQRNSRAGVAGYLNKLDVKDAKGLIARAQGDVTTEFRNQDEKDAFIKFAAAPSKVKALLYDMAYTVARASEPGGRLTDRDVANALLQLGYNENGFVSADIFKEVLTQKVNNEVGKHSQHRRQLYLAGLSREAREQEMANPQNSYNFPQIYGYMTDGPVPAWLGQAAPAPQQQAAPVAQEQTSLFPDFPKALVSAPLQIGPNQSTTLAQFSTEFSPHYFTKTGELKDEDSILRDYGIPEKSSDGKTLQGGARLDEFEKLLMSKYGYTQKKAREEVNREIDALTEIMQNTKNLGLAPQLKDASRTYLESWQSP